jgi:lipooligosaccharide transport system ATP-binding protein
MTLGRLGVVRCPKIEVSGLARTAEQKPRPGGIVAPEAHHTHGAESSNILSAVALSKAFGHRTVVDRLDLEIPAGGCFGMLGPNGAGKTTTINMVLGRNIPSSGALQVLGMPMPAYRRQVRQRLGLVPQSDNLDPDFTGAENLVVYGSYFGIATADARERIGRLLDFVELADRRDAPINTLSGGMRRRLSIARSLINDPELLILDEPTTGLDPQVRHLIWSRLRELKQSGKTLLLTTHYMEEAERLCDDLIIIDEGVVIARGSPRALIREHVEPQVVEITEPSDTARQSLAERLGSLPGVRIERFDQTLYCYAHSERAVLHALESDDSSGEGLGTRTYVHRPANLEDVFLNLTGRDLREEG